MREQERLNLATKTVLEQIRQHPDLFIPSKEEKEKVFEERERLDLQLKQKGRDIILPAWKGAR